MRRRQKDSAKPVVTCYRVPALVVHAHRMRLNPTIEGIVLALSGASDLEDLALDQPESLVKRQNRPSRRA